jgi:hypothetical protein
VPTIGAFNQIVIDRTAAEFASHKKHLFLLAIVSAL